MICGNCCQRQREYFKEFLINKLLRCLTAKLTSAVINISLWCMKNKF